jgi:acyl carrier protein
MDQVQALERIRNVIADIKAETSPVPVEEITAVNLLTEPPLGMDSLEFAKLVISLEEEFGFIAEDEDFVISSMRTVDDVVRIVLDRLVSTAT